MSAGNLLFPWNPRRHLSRILNWYFIECQDRKRYQKDLLHKIAYVRGKQRVTTFVFVHATSLPAELTETMTNQGVTASGPLKKRSCDGGDVARRDRLTARTLIPWLYRFFADNTGACDRDMRPVSSSAVIGKPILGGLHHEYRWGTAA
jgi:hypothetical protein